jgi:hypothetical protein
MDHKYDDPDLTPLQFLKAVYRDKTVPMSMRIEAAKVAYPYVYSPTPPSPRFEDLDPQDQFTVHIGGLPGSNAAVQRPPPKKIHAAFTLPGKCPLDPAGPGAIPTANNSQTKNGPLQPTSHHGDQKPHIN